jgi:hypothetical protein
MARAETVTRPTRHQRFTLIQERPQGFNDCCRPKVSAELPTLPYDAADVNPSEEKVPRRCVNTPGPAPRQGLLAPARGKATPRSAPQPRRRADGYQDHQARQLPRAATKTKPITISPPQPPRKTNANVIARRATAMPTNGGCRSGPSRAEVPTGTCADPRESGSWRSHAYGPPSDTRRLGHFAPGGDLRLAPAAPARFEPAPKEAMTPTGTEAAAARW